jgi:hypothetical protein
MGIFDFFKKKEEKIIEKIKFSDISNYADNKKKLLEESEKRFIEDVQREIFQLISEIKQETKVLREINLENRKVEEKLKQISKENLKAYYSYLERFKEDLDSIKTSDVEKLIYEIDKCLVDFNKRSLMSFEKATILVGKELGDVRESIARFFKNFRELIENNNTLFKDKKLIALINKSISDLNNNESAIINVIKEIDNNSKNEKSLNEESERLGKTIETLEKGEEHKNMLESKKNLEIKKQELKKEILNLRALIDFKALQKIFHLNPKKMKILEDYKNNFYENFNRDYGEELTGLIIEAKLENEEIENKIKEINTKLKELENLKIEEDKTLALKEEIKILESRIKEINIENEKLLKIKENLKSKNKEILENLKKELMGFDVELESG